jgi:DNA polymerase-3 subunit delta'
VIPKWLDPTVRALASARTADHFPHALLIHDAVGAGGDWLASYAAQLALCLHPTQAPCGTCLGCKRVAARQHPDLLGIHPSEDSRQIRIEQIRDLAAELALTSHQGGYKVGIISPADALNRFAANALLKTLEEPPPHTLLILVASQPSLLPATILSRCQRIRIRAPARSEALEWLEAARGPGDWNAILDALGEAPFLAAEVDAAAIPAVATETFRTLAELEAGGADPAATAERWSRSEPALRLRCFENWLTERIRRQFAGARPDVEKRGAAHLPRAAPVTNIRGLFELADGVRDLRSALDTPINKSLAFEALLRQLGPSRDAGAARTERR